MFSKIDVPEVQNEPLLTYEPESPERAEIKEALARILSDEIEIPLLIGGEEVRTGNMGTVIMPDDHGQVLASWHKAGPTEIRQAVDAAEEAHREWAAWRWEERIAVFLKAAELLSTRWRAILNASTMLGQSKTVFQAEIDSAAELIDFFRFNAAFAERIFQHQPRSAPGVWNWSDYRALEGFVYAITPFNFTAIGGNLPGAPALMGNTVVWKPAHSAILSNYYIARLLEEAGLPPGVINFVPGSAVEVSKALLSSSRLAGIHFTGSTEVFQALWSQVGSTISHYRSYPRLVGETGGKDFIIAHPSGDPDATLTAILRGAFEYQGQKCSAASRAYIPRSMWNEIGDRLVEETEAITMGSPLDFRNFMTAVIDKPAFDKITGYIEHARQADDAEVIAGGQSDDSTGYYIRPTIIRADRPDYRSMCDEIFGPVMSVHVYEEKDWSQMLGVVDATSPYALTGAVFARDRKAIQQAHRVLRFSAGNFYVNDKPTGAVVGQQPFGGARASGTNDKAGSILNLLRWVSPRSVKENFAPPTDYRYPFMAEE